MALGASGAPPATSLAQLWQQHLQSVGQGASASKAASTPVGPTQQSKWGARQHRCWVLTRLAKYVPRFGAGVGGGIPMTPNSLGTPQWSKVEILGLASEATTLKPQCANKSVQLVISILHY